MSRFRKWWSEESAKVRDLPAGERLQYIWEYYRLWIIGTVTLVCFLTWGIYHYVTTDPDTWFFACFANTRADIGNNSEFYDDYADYAGYDLSEKPMEFNASLYVDPLGKTAGNQYYQLLMAYLDSGTLDVLVMGREHLQRIGATGRLMDLEDPKMQAIYEKYRDRLVWCEPFDEEYGKEEVAVGIDLDGTVLTGEDGPYPESAVLGINALAPHPEEADTFLRYLFEGSD